MKNFSCVITDPNGIHARPAGVLVKNAAKYQSSIRVECPNNGKKADGKRLMALMAMGVKSGMQINVTVDGPDEEAAAAELQAFINENFCN